MACNPLAINVGFFIPITPWSVSLNDSNNGRTVIRTAGVALNPGIQVKRPHRHGFSSDAREQSLQVLVSLRPGLEMF